MGKLQYFYGNDKNPTRIMELIELQISELFLKTSSSGGSFNTCAEAMSRLRIAWISQEMK